MTAPAGPNPFAEASARLLDGLAASGRITAAQRAQVLAHQAQSGAYLGEALVQLGLIQADEWPPLLVKHCRIPFVSLLDYLVDAALLAYVPAEVCQRLRVLPVDKMGRHLTLAMVQPLDHQALAEVQALNPTLVIRPILCAPDHFEEVGRRLFGGAALEMSATLLQTIVPAKPAKKAASLVSPKPEPDPGPDLDAAPQDPLGSSSLDLAGAMSEMLSMAQESMDGTYEVLARRIALFHGIEPRAVARIFALGVTKEVPAGEVLFKKGEAGDSLYVIVSGCVRILDNGKEIAVLSAGDAFGEMSIVTGEPRSADAVAVQPTSLLVLTEGQFRKLLTKNVSIRLLLNMLGAMSARLRKSNDILRSLIR